MRERTPGCSTSSAQRMLPGIPTSTVWLCFSSWERASGRTEGIAKFLGKEGFAVLETSVLDPEGARRAAARIRGGNWSGGPWPVSGGPPAIVIAAFDCFPCMEHLAESPCAYHNVRIQRAKVRLR